MLLPLSLRRLWPCSWPLPVEGESVGGAGRRVGSPCDWSRADHSGGLCHHHVVCLIGHGLGREDIGSVPHGWICVDGAVDMRLCSWSSIAHRMGTVIVAR